MSADLWDDFDEATTGATPGLWEDFDKPAALAPRAAVPNAPSFAGVTSSAQTSALGDPVDLPPVAATIPDGFLGGLADIAANPIGALHRLTAPVARGIAGADLGGAFERGAVGALAGSGHALGDFIDLTVQQANPLPQIIEAGGGVVPDAMRDPLGARALADEALAVNREVAADRAAAMPARPTMADVLATPDAALEQFGARAATMGAESAPLYAAALATRNPAIGSGVLGGVTGGQTFTDMRGQGLGRADAAQAAALTAMAEAAGEGVSLPGVMRPGPGGFAGAVLGEGGQEALVELAQTNIADQALGAETPIVEQLLGALDAAAVGGGLGGAGYVASNAPALLRRPAPTAAPQQPPAAPEPAAAPTATTPRDEAGMPVEDDADLVAMVQNLLSPDVAAALGIEPEAVPATADRLRAIFGDGATPAPELDASRLPPVIDADRIASVLGEIESAETPSAAPPAPAATPTPEQSGQASAPQSAPAGAGADLSKPKANATMQNRDRSRPASVAQMQDIRRNPDPARLGFSRDANTGAPMVARGQEVAEADRGRTDSVVMPDGRRVQVQYAVVEADAVQASHFADGQVNPAYEGAPLQALNNGRTAGLQAAWQSGSADPYREGLAADTGLHGVSAEAINGKRQPMLVRLYDPSENLTGAESNASQQLGLSPVEQAQTDAASLPDLTGLNWNDDGSIPVNGNAEFFRSWFRNMGDTAAATLQDSQGRPNAAAVQRLRAAMIGRAYGDERLLAAAAEDVNPDNRNILNALAQAATSFATLEQDEPLADSVRSALVGGLELVREAANQGQSLESLLEQGDLLGRNANAVAIARFMAANTRSARRMAEAFREIAAYTDRAQRQAANLDVFGGPPPSTAGDAINAAGIEGADAATAANDAAAGYGSREPAGRGRAAAGEPDPRQPATGLFGSPTPRERVDAAGRERSDRRSGRDRDTPGVGGLPLFAGRAPEQADIEAGALPEKDVSSYGKTRPLSASGQPGGAAPEAGRQAGRGAPALRGQFDLFVATRGQQPPGQGHEPVVKVDRAKLAQSARLVETGQFRSGVNRVRSLADAAHILAPLRKSAQERFMVLALGEEGAPLAVMQHQVGEIDGVSVNPGMVLGAIASIPGVKSIVFAHNHPSGNPNPSAADLSLDQRVIQLFKGSGIEVRGSIILQPGRRTFTIYGENNETASSAAYATTDAIIPPRRRTGAVPMVERRLRKVASPDRKTVASPVDAEAMARQARAESPAGVVLLDNQHKLVGVLPFDAASTAVLRTGDLATSHARYIAQAIEANAAAAIVYGDRADQAGVRNMARAMVAGGLRVLDTFPFDGDRTSSQASIGRGWGDGVLESVEPAFYSALARSVEQAKGAPKRGSAEQWKQWLDGAQRRGEFRQSERDWLGVDAWLDGRGATTREELAEFVRANEVQVQDVVLGEPSADDRNARQREIMAQLEREFGITAMDDDADGYDWITLADDEPITDWPPAAASLRDEWMSLDSEERQIGGPAKFASYQLPGGQNYRELLLTLPQERVEADPVDTTGWTVETVSDEAYYRYTGQREIRVRDARGDVKLTRVGFRGTNEEAIAQAAQAFQRDDVTAQRDSKDFRSSHFDQPNILAHVRFNERTDADGKRVLFLEEIQSDWHQDGRKRGYTGAVAPFDSTGWSARRTHGGLGNGQVNWRVESPDGRSWTHVGPADATEQQIVEAAAGRTAEQAERESGRVPDAPLKATDEWAMLAFKRMVRYAAENGFDRIAWTTGAQQAERYDLSKQVSAVRAVQKGTGTWHISADRSDGSTVLNEPGVPTAKVEDYFGKEVAKKLLDAAPDEFGARELRGDDLKIGGSGMRAFYDKILPSAVNKWAKRFGGRVGEARIDNTPVGSTAVAKMRERDPGYAMTRVHAIDLTPAMRDAALAGQPLFNREPGTESPSTNTAFESLQQGEADAEMLGLRDAVNRVLGERGDDVIYLHGTAGLPDRLRRGIERRMEQRSGRGRTAALYDPVDQQVYLFTDVVTEPDRAVWNVMHEFAGHHGLRTLLGDKLAPALEIALQNPTVKAVADAIAAERNIDTKTRAGRLLAAEEALAELSAAVRTGDYGAIARRYSVDVPEGIRAKVARAIENFVARLKRLLDDLFGERVFTDEDVRELLEAAWQAANGEVTMTVQQADGTSTREQVAFHGTPYTVDRFSLQRIGTGEGAQAFGWGLYFASQREIAEHYRNTLAGSDVALTDKGRADLADVLNFAPAIVVDVAGQLADGGDRSRIASGLRDTWPGQPQDNIRYRALVADAVESGDLNGSKGGNVYQVEVPEDSDLLDWDAPLAEQPEKVRAAIMGMRAYRDASDDLSAAKAARDADAAAGNWGSDAMLDYDSLRIRFRKEWGEDSSGEGIYKKLGSPQDASETLLAAGIPGLRYLDGGSRAAGDGSRNYVIWDEAAIGDPESDSILESVEESGARAEQRRNEAAGVLPVDRGAAGWNYDAKEWEGRKGALNAARASLQDKMLSWRDVQNQIASQVGKAIPDAQNVYRLENLMHGRVKEALDRIEEGQVVPLMDAMKAARVKPATLEEYLYARHAKERNAQIAEINPKMPDGGSGMTNAEADAILSSADKATLEPLAKRVDAMTRATRRRLLQHGLITQAQHDAMEAQYTAYVPLKGKQTGETEFGASDGGAGRGLDSRARPVREAMGRGAGNRATDILGHVIADAQRSVIIAEKARVGRAVMRLVLANPNPALWQVEPVQTERAINAAGEVYERVVNDWSDPSVVAVRLKGQLYKVEINNRALAQALNNVGVDQLGAVTRAAGAINRYFSAVLTKYNPAFVPVNASRDALFGLTGLASEHGESAALDAALHYPQAARAAFRQAVRKGGGGQWDTWANEFAEAGGKTGYVAMPSAEDLARKIGKGGLTSYSPTGLARATRAIGDAVGALNDAVENALRLSAYVTLRKRGMSVDAAAEYAKNLTVNFNRKGFDGSKLNAWFLFYNASIQGAHRVSKLLRSKKAWGYMAGLASLQVIAAMAAMGMEDDEGEPLWNKVPDHVKRRNIVIVTPDGGVLTIPMPYGLNVVTYGAGRFTGALLDKEEGKRSNAAGAITGDMLSAFAESFSPVPIGEGGLGLLPTVLRIPVNVQTNRNDFGHAIRSEQPFSKYDMPRASMGRPDTLEVFKLIATGLNRIGGGDEYTPPSLSWFDVAPEDVEYLLGELTGGAGRFIVDAATWAQKVTGELPMKPSDRPIVKRFVTAIDEQASQSALFYDRRDVIARSLDKLRDTYESKGEAAAEAMLAAMPELTGADFRRRKRDSDKGPAGSIITVDGRPQIVVGDDRSVYGRYKAAEEMGQIRNDGIRNVYRLKPAGLIPTEDSRRRDNITHNYNVQRESAHREFNAAWVRDVVGATEPDGGPGGGVRRSSLPESRRAEYVGVGAGGTATAAPDVLDGAKNAPKLVMVGDWSGIKNPAVRKRLDDGALGVYDPEAREAFVVMGLDPAEAKFVAYHEIAGHHGLQGALGDSFESVLNRAMQNPTIDKLARAMGREAYKGEFRLVRVEEALSELAAARKTGDYGRIEKVWGVRVPASAQPGVRGMLNRAVQLTKRKLADLTGDEPDAFNDEQVYTLIEDAWQYVEDGSRRGE